MSVAAAVSALAGVPGPVTTVEEWNGLPTFMVNGRPHMSTSFETYVPNVRHFRQMSEAGATVFGFPTNAGEEPWWHSTPTWVGPGVWDFSELDESVGKILEANPRAYIMPRINVSEPAWWCEENPDELMVFDDGTTDQLEPHRLWPALKSRKIASIASARWRRDMSASLRRLIDHIQSSPYADRVFGYQVFGQATEEWYHYTSGGRQLSDYSVHMRRAFQDWLRCRYGTEEALRASWGKDVTFDTAEVPTREERLSDPRRGAFRDPRTEMNVVDFYAFYNEIIPETIDLFCGVVKESCEGTKVVGAFYAYMFEFAGNAESGHLAVQKLLQSHNVDFIVVTASYGNRQLGTGGSILRSPHTSLRLHGKLWYEDNDTVSFLFPEVSQRIGDAEWERSKVVLAATDTAEESKWIYQRGAGFVLGNGVYQALFDLHGGYYDHPELLRTVSDIYRMFNESAKYDRRSAGEILVIADERSVMYNRPRSPLLSQNLYDPPYRMIKLGAPYDAVYLNDLERLDTRPYKFFVVLNAYCLDARQKALLEEKVRGPGGTVLWVYGPGLFAPGEATPEVPSEVTGISLRVDPYGEPVSPRIRLEENTDTFVDRLTAAAIREVGPEAAAAGAAWADDPDATVLGRDAEGRPTLVQKKTDRGTSLYSVTASLPSDFYREAARAAGVHIYNDRNDTLYVSQGYLTVNADGAGTRELRFPGPVTLHDPFTDEVLAEGVETFALSLRDKETRILRLERLTRPTDDEKE